MRIKRGFILSLLATLLGMWAGSGIDAATAARSLPGTSDASYCYDNDAGVCPRALGLLAGSNGRLQLLSREDVCITELTDSRGRQSCISPLSSAAPRLAAGLGYAPSPRSNRAGFGSGDSEVRTMLASVRSTRAS